jgi:type VI protein secretion system component VasK
VTVVIATWSERGWCVHKVFSSVLSAVYVFIGLILAIAPSLHARERIQPIAHAVLAVMLWPRSSISTSSNKHVLDAVWRRT